MSAFKTTVAKYVSKEKHQADSPFYVWPDVWSGICKLKKSMVIHDTECPYWDQVSLNNTNQTKPQKKIFILLSWKLARV